MTRVHVEGAIGEPAARPAEVGWDDKSTTIGRTYWYRLTAADTAGNESQPSTCVQGKPFRTDAPPPPTWANAAWRADGTMIDLQWTPQEPDLRYLVRRRRDDVARWTTITDWLPDGSVNYADATAAPGVPHYYQIKARDAAGNVSTRSIPRLVPPL
jgi:fibronectin type 3 domain-containing protein